MTFRKYRRAAAGLTALALALALPLTAEAEDRDGWDCNGTVCVQTEAVHLGTLEGTFDYGPNVSTSSETERLAALQAQRYREFLFDIPVAMKLRAELTKDPDYLPADWPSDISTGNASPWVDLYASAGDGEWKKVDQGALLPAGSALKLVVVQDTWGSAYRTFYPAHWFVDVSYRLVRVDAGWNADTPAAAPVAVGDAAAALAGQGGNCRDRDCREPEPQLVAEDPGGCGGEGEAECLPDNGQQPVAVVDDMAATATPCGGEGEPECVVPDAADLTAPADDPTPVVDPTPGDCGADMMECLPDNGQVPEPVVSDESAALARMAQRELARLGCYDMDIDGQWGPGSTRAMTNYNRWNGSDWPVDRATALALEDLMGAEAPVCGVD